MRTMPHSRRSSSKEIPIPTEKAMLVRLLMSLSEKYELEGTTITVGLGEVRAVFRFPEHDLPKLRAIAENWADAEGNKILANSDEENDDHDCICQAKAPVVVYFSFNWY